jgi:hypothetical protein
MIFPRIYFRYIFDLFQYNPNLIYDFHSIIDK